MALAFVPLSPPQLRAWAEGRVLSGSHPAYAVTSAMTAAFELSDPEDAEYAALCIASIAGLIAHGRRLVAVVEARVEPSADDFGQVSVRDLGWAAVTSLFGEDPDPAPAAATQAAIAGLSLADAWEAASVQMLLADTDLLWYGPAEWGALAD